MILNTTPRRKRSRLPIIVLILIIIIGLGIWLYSPTKKDNENQTAEQSGEMEAVQDNTTNKMKIIIPYEVASLVHSSITPLPSPPLSLPNDISQYSEPLDTENFAIGDGSLILIPQNNNVSVYKAETGDSLSTLFNKAGLSTATMYKVLESLTNDQKKNFTNLNIGQSFEFTLNESGDLLTLTTHPNLLNTYTLSKQDNGYVYNHNRINPTYEQVYAYGIINSSLFNAADKANVPHMMIMEIANAFGYDIDFALDLRQGDEFEAIFERKLVDGKIVGVGNLLAARFVNRGKEYTAIRYTDSKGSVNYYRADGTAMKRAFIRTPVDFTRISSRFSLGRYHPVLNRIRAHKGVDYAAPTGTAIRAAGNGKIVSIGWKGGYGKAIVIQHGKTYSTLYGHMSKFAPGLKVGSQVKQSQTIGYVGMTGLATGPHLHYEFRVNGQHVDPLSVKLPMADPLSTKEKAKFLKASRPLLGEMDKNKAIKLAAKQSESENEKASDQDETGDNE